MKPTSPPRVATGLLTAAVGLSGCVYFNTLYNAERDYGRGERAVREGRRHDADVAFDSVIARTGRVLADHPDSKYADDAAILKARSEIHRGRWESAYVSAEIAARTASESGVRALAAGLMGVAAFRLGDLVAAEAHLDRALEAEVAGRDRTTFLFLRGRARLARDDGEAAAEDLRAAVEQAQGSGLDRVELASALMEVGEYDQAVVLFRGLLASADVVDLAETERALADTLVVHSPALLAAELDGLIEAATRPTKLAVLHLHRGRARAILGRRDEAMRDYRAAYEAASNTRSAGEAGYREARLVLADAGDAEEVAAAAGGLHTAERVASAAIRDSAQALLAAVQRFGGLIGAFESRRTSAAEALLRAAEVARDGLAAPALARGLYLRYLEVAPRSPWAAKAALGALALAGHSGHGILGATDLGPQTDEELRDRLRALGPADPYVQARTRLASAVAESTYARSERELQRRLADIRGLFEPAAPPPAEEDSAAAPADTTPARRDTGRVER